MADILSKEVLFNDGEGLDHADLNDLQRYARALVADGILAQHARLGDVGHGGASASHLFAIGNAGAPYAGAGTAEALFRPGTVFQRLAGNFTGDDPQTLIYYLDQDEPTQAHPAAAAGMERWDLYSIALAQEDADPADQVSRDIKDAITGALSTTSMGKVRKVAATIALTQGTEVASGAVEPALPAGHLKLAAFRVYDGMGAFDPTTDIRDYRVPALGWSVPTIPGGQFGYLTGWGKGEPGTIAADGSGARKAWAHVPMSGASRRLIQVGLGSSLIAGSGAIAELMRVDLTASILGAVETLIETITGSLLSAGTNAFRTYDVVGSLGTPLWTNGYAAGYAVDRVAARPESLALKVTSGATHADQFLVARFWIAG